MSKKTIPPIGKAAGKPGAKKPAIKCRAAEVGHRSCKCGGPYCGASIHEP